MVEPGEPSTTLQMLGIHRTELENLGGKTVLIYSANKMTIIIPDSIDFTSLDVIAKTKDITIKAKDITIQCDNIDIEAKSIHIKADDTTIEGNFTTKGGITSLNPD